MRAQCAISMLQERCNFCWCSQQLEPGKIANPFLVNGNRLGPRLRLMPSQRSLGEEGTWPFPTGNGVRAVPSPTGQRCAGSAECPSLCRSRGEEGTLPQQAGCGVRTSPRPTHWTSLFGGPGRRKSFCFPLHVFYTLRRGVRASCALLAQVQSSIDCSQSTLSHPTLRLQQGKKQWLHSKTT